jgi:hypothetical protein
MHSPSLFTLLVLPHNQVFSLPYFHLFPCLFNLILLQAQVLPHQSLLCVPGIRVARRTRGLVMWNSMVFKKKRETRGESEISNISERKQDELTLIAGATSVYRGIFSIPVTTRSASGYTLSANFKGPVRSWQVWTFEWFIPASNTCMLYCGWVASGCERECVVFRLVASGCACVS